MDRPPVHELSTVNGHCLRFKCRATPGCLRAEGCDQARSGCVYRKRNTSEVRRHSPCSDLIKKPSTGSASYLTVRGTANAIYSRVAIRMSSRRVNHCDTRKSWSMASVSTIVSPRDPKTSIARPNKGTKSDIGVCPSSSAPRSCA